MRKGFMLRVDSGAVSIRSLILDKKFLGFSRIQSDVVEWRGNAKARRGMDGKKMNKEVAPWKLLSGRGMVDAPC